MSNFVINSYLAFYNSYSVEMNNGVTNERGKIEGSLGSNSATGEFHCHFYRDDADDFFRNLMFRVKDAESTGYFIQVRHSYTGDATAGRRNKILVQIRESHGGGNVMSCYGSTNLADNTWYYVICRMTTGGMEIDLDGVAETLTFTTGSSSTQYPWFDNLDGGDGDCYIGQQRYGGTDAPTVAFKGNVDEIFFTNANSSIDNTTPYDVSTESEVKNWYRCYDNSNDSDTVMTDEVGSNNGTWENITEAVNKSTNVP